MCSRGRLFLSLLLPLGLTHCRELIVYYGLVLCLFVIVYCFVVGLCCCMFGCFFVFFVFPIVLMAFRICKLWRSDLLFFTDVVFFAGQLLRCPLMNLYPHFQQSGILLLFDGVGSMHLLCVCCLCICIRLIPDPLGLCAWVLLIRCWFFCPLFLVIALCKVSRGLNLLRADPFGFAGSAFPVWKYFLPSCLLDLPSCMVLLFALSLNGFVLMIRLGSVSIWQIGSCRMFCFWFL